MPTLTIAKPRGFSLNAASDFYSAFTPGSGMAVAATSHLTLAFRLDKSFEAVAVALREEPRSIVAEYEGTADSASLTAQVSRILGLEADGDAWLAIGRRDPIVGNLQAEFPGFFTAAKPSPYDAAVWGVISPRMQMRAAAKLKSAIGEAHGDRVTLHGRAHSVFPSPAQLARIEQFPGLSEEKLARLHGIARAAAGRLDAARLRAMNEDDALAELQSLRGVGPWTASHILFRGAAAPTRSPLPSRACSTGSRTAYGLASPAVETFTQVAESWRPFRMWVCILLSRHLSRVDGWRNPELPRERAKAGQRLRARTTRRAASTRNLALGFGAPPGRPL